LGAALVTGRPQAFAVVPGPGLLNASAAMLTAYGMGAPVLALVGQIPSFAIDRGHGHLHELHDQLGLMRHFTRFAARIESPQQAPGLVDAALRVAGAAPQGPVALECAIDTWGSRGPAQPTPFAPRPEMPIDREAISRAARLLGAAERPLIVVGGGALAAGREVQAVAELLNAPVCSFRRGRGTIPTSHRLAVSFTEGHHFWKEADAVLAIGTRLYWQEGTWGVDEKLPIVRIDADPAAFDRFRRPACALLGDAVPALRAMLAVLCKHNRPRPNRQGELDAARAWFRELLGRLQPQCDFLAAIRAALPPDGIFVEDVTQLGFVSRLAWPVGQPRLYLSPGYQDNLGWAYGAALGAQAALPGRKVVAVMGDGGFMYQAQEVATAMRHKLPVVGVVFDDGAFGNVQRIQEQQYGNRLIACDLHNPDFLAYAQCFGAAGFRAETPAALESALREAFALNCPALVHVPCGQMPSPWDMILLPRVRGFADAWRPALP
jgi:acetolactate synthase I/II/III large subunit